MTKDDFDNPDDYYAALCGRQWLTPKEYAFKLGFEIDMGEEHYAESYTQYRSECAMFGDAGPGQAADLQFITRTLREDRARLERVNRVIRNLAA